jgi:transposase
VTERTGHLNRIRSLLVAEGIREVRPSQVDFAKVVDWEGKALGAALQAELKREQERLQLLDKQIAQIEEQRLGRLATPQHAADRKAQKLMQLRGVGPVSSALLGGELFGWRTFSNRRQVGAIAGLTGTPYDSGDSRRDQGISKAGNRRVRQACVELAWNWIRFQPESPLTAWFKKNFGASKRARRIGIVAVARKLLIALWRYVEQDQLPEGAILKPAADA